MKPDETRESERKAMLSKISMLSSGKPTGVEKKPKKSRFEQRMNEIRSDPVAWANFRKEVDDTIAACEALKASEWSSNQEQTSFANACQDSEPFIIRSCWRCTSYFQHDLQAQAHIFASSLEFTWHMNTQHSLWKDLILKMIIPDTGPNAQTQYRCPTAKCSFRSLTEADVRTHCLEECQETIRARYVDMYNQDANLNRRLGLFQEVLKRGLQYFNGFKDVDPVELVNMKLQWKDVVKAYVNEKIPLLPLGAVQPVVEEQKSLADRLFEQMKMNC